MKLLGNDDLIKDVKRHLRISDCCGGLPFQWNEVLNQLEIKSKKKRYRLAVRVGVATLYLIIALVQAFRVIDRASTMVIVSQFVNCT